MPIEVNTQRVAGPIPEGIHPFEITGMEVKDSRSSEHPYIAVTLSCVAQGPNEGKTVWANLSYSPKARWKMEEFLDAVGAPADVEDWDAEEVIGDRIRVLIEHGTTPDGNTRENASKLLPWEETEGVVPEAKDFSRLESRRKKRSQAKKVEEAVDLSEEANPPS